MFHLFFLFSLGTHVWLNIGWNPEAEGVPRCKKLAHETSFHVGSSVGDELSVQKLFFTLAEANTCLE